MIYGQNPKYRSNGPSCSQIPKFYNMGEVHRLVERRTSQAYGEGKGVPVTGYADGEEIVETYMKV